MIPRRTKYIIDHENNKAWLSYGHSDIFKKAFGVSAQGIGIGCAPGTQLYATYTGDMCDLKNI